MLLLPPRAVRLPMELTGPGSSPAPAAAAAVVARLSAAAVVGDACPAALPAHVLPGAGFCCGSNCGCSCSSPCCNCGCHCFCLYSCSCSCCGFCSCCNCGCGCGCGSCHNSCYLCCHYLSSVCGTAPSHPLAPWPKRPGPSPYPVLRCQCACTLTDPRQCDQSCCCSFPWCNLR